MKYLFLLAIFLLALYGDAQVKANPLENERWSLFGVGASSADGISWQAAFSQSKRSDIILTGYRIAFSQELIAAPDDSCTSSKTRNLEVGVMWGDCWGGDTWYVSGCGGMGLVQRWWCDDIAGDTIPKHVSRLTLGVPGQIEFGLGLSDKMKIGVAVLGNWNFLQPYVGVLLNVSYWPGRKRE